MTTTYARVIIGRDSFLMSTRSVESAMDSPSEWQAQSWVWAWKLAKESKVFVKGEALRIKWSLVEAVSYVEVDEGIDLEKAV